MDYLTELFCHIDDFCKAFEPQYKKYLIQHGKKRNRNACISLSEIMTVYVQFHLLRFRQFKYFYLFYIKLFCRDALPKMPSYSRFVELYPAAIAPMAALLEASLSPCEGLSFVDSTPLRVCHNRRIYRHKTFAGLAARGKTSMGWFFGFKLHLAINHKGELLDLRLTSGNTDDRKGLEKLARSLFGLVFADKGYLGKALQKKLTEEEDIRLITSVKKSMKKPDYTEFERKLLKKRSLIETVFEELKGLMQIEHSRHRSHAGFMMNLLSGLVAYCWMPKKPSIQLDKSQSIVFA